MAEGDQEIACAMKDCTQVRVFTTKDQAFYKEKGFTPPKYCREHSAARRAAHQAREQEGEQTQRESWDPKRGRDHRSTGPSFGGNDEN